MNTARLTTPMNLAEARKYVYGYPRHSYVEGQCVQNTDGGYFFLDRQCTKPNGHGPHGLYCEFHAKRLALLCEKGLVVENGEGRLVRAEYSR